MEIRETTCSRELQQLPVYARHKSSHKDLMALDVLCAFLHAHADRELYVGLPRERQLCHSGSYVGNLRPVCMEQETDATLL